MKRLNNGGWGLSTFLSFIVLFILMILLISFIADKVGIGDDSDSSIDKENIQIIN